VEVVVVLAAVEGEVAGVTHDFGNGFDVVGEMDADVFRNDLTIGPAGGAMLMGAGGGLVNAGDHGGAAGGADGSGDEGAFEEDAIGCELIDDGGEAFVDGVIVAAHVGGEVFGEDPEDVGAVLGGEEGGKESEGQESDFHEREISS